MLAILELDFDDTFCVFEEPQLDVQPDADLCELFRGGDPSGCTVHLRVGRLGQVFRPTAQGEGRKTSDGAEGEREPTQAEDLRGKGEFFSKDGFVQPYTDRFKRFTSPHTCSIGFKSVEYGDQFRTGIPLFASHCSVILPV